jgi:cell division transport system ATP-binding protein
MAQTLIKYNNINVYQDENLILENVSLDISEGEFVYITGKVGSGKSSFLKTLYGELPCNGSGKQRKSLEGTHSQADILGYDMLKIHRSHLPGLRRGLGVIFQDFQLLTDRTVEENLRFVLKATGWKRRTEIDQRISDVLSLVEMTDKASKYPAELSGGEQQRIAIARAILNKPRLILADEPTGNLDSETSRKITELLRSISQAGSAVVIITHNLSLLQDYPGRVFHCNNHRMTEITGNSPAIAQQHCEAEEDETQSWKDLTLQDAQSHES